MAVPESSSDGTRYFSHEETERDAYDSPEARLARHLQGTSHGAVWKDWAEQGRQEMEMLERIGWQNMNPQRMQTQTQMQRTCCPRICTQALDYSITYRLFGDMPTTCFL
jgi:hypothetical protein